MAVPVAWQFVDLGQHIGGFPLDDHVELQLAVKLHISSRISYLLDRHCWVHSACLQSAELIWRLSGRVVAVASDFLAQGPDIEDLEALNEELQLELQTHVAAVENLAVEERQLRIEERLHERDHARFVEGKGKDKGKDKGKGKDGQLLESGPASSRSRSPRPSWTCPPPRSPPAPQTPQ